MTMITKLRLHTIIPIVSWALARERCKLIKYAFPQRTMNEWNRLPGEMCNATSVNMFKNKIDKYF